MFMFKVWFGLKFGLRFGWLKEAEGSASFYSPHCYTGNNKQQECP